MQAQTNTSGVQLFGGIKETKKFKQFFLIILLDANARVFNLDFNHSIL